MKKLFLLTAAACLLLASLAGCTAETPLLPNEAEGDDDLCTFTLSAGSRVSVETRAIDEKTIKDVWVVQLNATGTTALTAPQYLTADAGKIKAQLAKKESKIYFFVNTNNATLFNPAAALGTFTTATVEAVKITHTGDWGTRTYMPMYGTWTGTPQAPTLTGDSNYKIELALVLAKIYFRAVASGLLIPRYLYVETIQLKNVPTSARMAPTASGVYPPATTASDFNDYPAQTINEILFGNAFTFYMPENCRGTGTERYQTEKNGTLLSGGERATYVEIKGRFGGASSTTKVCYRFYLGENNTNDYNIRRGYFYECNAIISGTNKTDMRVTVDPDYYQLSSGNTIKIGNRYWARTNLRQIGSGTSAAVSLYTEPWEYDVNGYWNWGMRDQKNYTGYLSAATGWGAMSGNNQNPCYAYNNSWGLPSKKQFEELIPYMAPQGTRVMINGTLYCVDEYKGYVPFADVFLVIDGNNVLCFPAAGYRTSANNVMAPGDDATYWTEDYAADDQAYAMNFGSEAVLEGTRSQGFSLRCVQN